MATDASQPDHEIAGPGIRRPNLTVLHRKARSALAEMLLADEEALLLIPGLEHGALIATDRRVLVFKRGARAGLPFSSRLKAFEYESVLRIDIRRSGALDLVVVHAPLKIASCASYWADDRDDPWRARNAVPIGRASAEIVDAVVELSRLVSAVRDRPRRSPGRKSAVLGEVAEPERDSRDGFKRVFTSARTDEPAGPAYEDCPRCGNTLRVGWKFCPRCGAPAKVAAERRSALRRRRRP